MKKLIKQLLIFIGLVPRKINYKLDKIKLLEKDFVSFDTNSSEYSYQFMDNEDCPIARALKRKLKLSSKELNVGVNSYSIRKGKNSELYLTRYIGRNIVDQAARDVQEKGYAIIKF